MQVKSISLYWMIPLLLLVMGLGSHQLNSDALWYDEYRTMYYAGGDALTVISPGETWNRVRGGTDGTVFPFQTPGYYMLYVGWVRLVGWSAFAGRTLSLLVGVFAVAVTYRLGRDLAHETDLDPVWVGFAAATVLGTSAFFVFYLHEMRSYTVIVLLTVLAMWIYWRALQQNRGNWWQFPALSLTFASLFYTHYLATLSALSIGVYHLLFAKKDRRWWQLSAAMAIAGIFALPWLSIALRTLGNIADDPRQSSVLSLSEMLTRIPFAFSNGNVVLLGILLVFAVRWNRPQRYVTVWTVTMLVLLIAVNESLRMLTELRYAIMLWAGLALMVGFGIGALAQRLHPGLILGLWVGVGLWTVNSASPLMVAFSDPTGDQYNNSYGEAFRPLPWEQLQHMLETRTQDGDVVAFHRPDVVWAIDGIFDHYLRNLNVPHRLMESLPGRDVPGEYDANVELFLADASRAWIAVDRTMPPTFRLDEFEQVLASEFAHCERVFRTETLQLDLYARQLDDPERITLHYDAGIDLYLLEPILANTNVQIAWRVADDVPLNTYSFAVHLEDNMGNLVYQVDLPLPGHGFTCAPVELPFVDVPAGDYSVWVVVYDWATGERLAGESAAETGERLKIGAAHVD